MAHRGLAGGYAAASAISPTATACATISPDEPNRDFLAIPDFTQAELLALLDLAARMKRGEYAGQPLAGKTLAMIFAKSSHPHPGLVRGRRLPARRPRALPLVARHPARPRRADPRHRAGALPLRRRHHDPHLRSRRRRGAGALRDRAGHQRPHRSAAPLPGAGRPAHDPASSSADWEGKTRRLGRRRQQHGQHAGSTPPARLGFELRLACPEGYEPERRDPARGTARRRDDHCSPRDPRGGGARRPRREHRRVGLDGPGGGAGRAGARLPGLHRGRAR